MEMLTAAIFVVVGSRDNLRMYYTERRQAKLWFTHAHRAWDIIQHSEAKN